MELADDIEATREFCEYSAELARAWVPKRKMVALSLNLDASINVEGLAELLNKGWRVYDRYQRQVLHEYNPEADDTDIPQIVTITVFILSRIKPSE
eukprot:m.269042 g.269042  ORF g.269042 m.269042 type:complete len:96 (+) comp81867_c0_seq1:252-539(+)